MMGAPPADALQTFLESAYLPEYVQPLRERGCTCAADISQELDKPGSDLVGAIGMKPLELKRLQRRLELAIVRYRALRPSMPIKAGIEKTSDEVGRLLEGEELVALEHVNSEDGTERVRFDRGWVSLTTAKGQPSLEQLGTSQPSGMVNSMLMQNSMSTSVTVTMGDDSGADSGGGGEFDVTLPSHEKLFALSACCCFKTSIYFAVPECVGCTSKGACCCYTTASQCKLSFEDPAWFNYSGRCAQCRVADLRDNLECCTVASSCTQYCCFVSKSKASCAVPKTCIKGGCQCGCCDCRAGFPPGVDPDVPCEIGCLGWFCVGGKKKVAPGSESISIEISQSLTGSVTAMAMDMSR